MKRITLIIFFLTTNSLVQAQDMKSFDTDKKVQPVIYTCTMHPQVRLPKPGNCPICGMKMVKEKLKPVKQSADKKNDEMQMPMKDTSKKLDNMDNLDIPKEKPQLIKQS